MATRGRKPTPTAIKELEGNPGKRKLNDKEPRPEKKAPSCPKWLEPEAKKEWRRLAKKMELMGVLTEVDMAGSRGIHHPARDDCENTLRLLAAGAPGVHRADVPEGYESLCGAVWLNPCIPFPHRCRHHQQRI